MSLSGGFHGVDSILLFRSGLRALMGRVFSRTALLLLAMVFGAAVTGSAAPAGWYKLGPTIPSDAVTGDTACLETYADNIYVATYQYQPGGTSCVVFVYRYDEDFSRWDQVGPEIEVDGTLTSLDMSISDAEAVWLSVTAHCNSDSKRHTWVYRLNTSYWESAGTWEASWARIATGRGDKPFVYWDGLAMHSESNPYGDAGYYVSTSLGGLLGGTNVAQYPVNSGNYSAVGYGDIEVEANHVFVSYTHMDWENSPLRTDVMMRVHDECENNGWGTVGGREYIGSTNDTGAHAMSVDAFGNPHAVVLIEYDTTGNGELDTGTYELWGLINTAIWAYRGSIYSGKVFEFGEPALTFHSQGIPFVTMYSTADPYRGVWVFRGDSGTGTSNDLWPVGGEIGRYETTGYLHKLGVTYSGRVVTLLPARSSLPEKQAQVYAYETYITTPVRPTIPQPLTPIGATNTPLPDFCWEEASYVEWYRVSVWNSDGTLIFSEWTQDTCWTPSERMSAGAYTWSVLAWNDDGYGQACDLVEFELVLTLPGSCTALRPSGKIIDRTPEFAWTESEGASWYHLTVVREGEGEVISKWIEAPATSWTPGSEKELEQGRYTWWIAGWNFNGYGAHDSEDFECVLPGPVTAVSPSGQTVDRTPTFVWTEADDATWYHLVIVNESGKTVGSHWTKVPAHSWTPLPGEPLAVGHYTWWVAAWNPNGYGPWDSEMFEVRASTPGSGKPGSCEALRPSGEITDPTPEFAWTAADDATWYFLVVTDAAGSTVMSKWTEAPLTTWTPDSGQGLSPGHYTWWIAGWNSYGYGLWDSEVFEVVSLTPGPTTPGPTTALRPSGVITNPTPEFVWTAADHATWYHLVVTDASGSTAMSKWTKAPTTSWTPDGGQELAPGHYTWWIAGWNPYGYGPWDSEDFEIVSPSPGPTSALRPSGGVADPTPEFVWTMSDHATWYHLVVTDAAGATAISEWSKAPATSWTPGSAQALASGHYVWKIAGWNLNGYGPWSGETAFSLGVSELRVESAVVSCACPEGANASARSLTVWNAVTNSGAMAYHIDESIPWISISPTGGVSNGEQDTLTISYQTASLATGSYSGTITVSAPGAIGSPQTVQLDLAVLSVPVTTPPASSQLWDKRFGGNSGDTAASVYQTSDGGYIVGGSSISGASGDKTEESRGSDDMWVVKIASNGSKQWDKRFGGENQDVLKCVQQTTDGGYVLGGYSYSDADGDKTEASRGESDMWVVKTDSNGAKEWDKRFGGTEHDYLSTLQQTSDGGYILGGTTWSDAGGDITDASIGGSDMWVVKIDPNGVRQWDKRYGGSDREFLQGLQQTADGGYILGGSSNSGVDGDKSESSRGFFDMWVVKIDANGVKQWDRRYGGSDGDYVLALQQTSDGGYIFGGRSDSGMTGDKTEASRGGSDYWLVKTDAGGNKQWDRTLGASSEDSFSDVQQTADRGYIVGGTTYSGADGDKTEASRGSCDMWVVKLDVFGNKQWDRRFGGGAPDELKSLQQTTDGGYILAGGSTSEISGDKSEASRGYYDMWLVRLGVAP